MRSKHIAALITFFAAFAFSAFVASLFAAPKFYDVPPVKTYEYKNYNHNRCGKGYKIKEFLLQDKQNGDDRRRYEYSDEGTISRLSLAEEADRIRDYADESGSMDASEFPRDFRAAWREHMRAWSDYADFMETAKTKRMTADDLSERENPYIKDINSTWYEVLEIGRSYGADLPAGF